MLQNNYATSDTLLVAEGAEGADADAVEIKVRISVLQRGQ